MTAWAPSTYSGGESGSDMATHSPQPRGLRAYHLDQQDVAGGLRAE